MDTLNRNLSFYNTKVKDKNKMVDEDNNDANAGNEGIPATDTPDNNYTNVYYDGNLPAATGMIAQTFGDEDPGILRDLCRTFYNFIKEPSPNLHQLSNDHNLYTAIIPLPSSLQCRLIYGFGIGTSPIGKTSIMDAKVLALYQEGSKDIGPPLPLMFPPEMFKVEERPCPKGNRVQRTLMNGNGAHTFPIYRSVNINGESASMMMIAPVPAHLFLDGFEKDLAAPMVYERLLQSADVQEEYIQHALNVVRAAMLQPNQNQKTVHMPMPALIDSGSCNDLRRWAKTKSSTMFPALCTQPQLPPPPAPIPAIRPLVDEEVQVIKQPVVTKPRISRREQAKLFTMLGYDEKIIPALSETDLPPHMLAVEEELSKHMKDSVIKERLATHCKYDEYPVPSHPAILETLRKRDYGGLDNFAHPSYAHACSKLSPFLCMETSETQMAKLQEMEEALRYASATTPADYMAIKSTKAVVPADYMEFINLLCTFANLIFSWFTAASPLYNQLKKLIDAVKAFHRTARSFFTLETKATILWLTFLQTRMYAEGTGEVFTPFTRMIDNLTAKDAMIHYAEVPRDLITNSRKAHEAGATPPPIPRISNKRRAEDTGFDTPEPPTKTVKGNPNNWHPKLQGAIGPMFEATKKQGGFSRNYKFSLKQICGFCGITLSQLNSDSKVCTSNKVLGYCYPGDRCKFKHQKASDSEADKILTMMDKIKDDQEGFLKSIKQK